MWHPFGQRPKAWQQHIKLIREQAMWNTAITRTYGVDYPFIGAGMAMIAEPELVAAVSQAGGIGQLGTGPLPPPLLRGLIREVRGRTSRPFAVNLIVETTTLGPATTDDHISVCAEERVPIAVFFWNPPLERWVAMLREAGCRVWVTVGSAAETLEVLPLDPDAIIVQGREAGGHVRATESLLDLLPRIRSLAADRPLIAAGGIADGHAAAAAFTAGASAVCVGTRLVASEECAAHMEYKMRLVASEPRDTIVTTLFGPEWPDAPMRVLINNAVRRALAPPAERSPAPSTIGETTVFGRQYAMPLNSSILPTVHTHGDFDEMCLAAGAGLSFVRKIEPAAAIVREIMDGAARELHDSISPASMRRLDRPAAL
jgi:NAD(P)H-dependent flavin oxidoreductase YrpB (nitropropane dioxygenase family)